MASPVTGLGVGAQGFRGQADDALTTEAILAGQAPTAARAPIRIAASASHDPRVVAPAAPTTFRSTHSHSVLGLFRSLRRFLHTHAGRGVEGSHSVLGLGGIPMTTSRTPRPPRGGPRSAMLGRR